MTGWMFTEDECPNADHPMSEQCMLCGWEPRDGAHVG